MISEADTCRQYVLPKLYGAGWVDSQIREQVTITDGRIRVVGKRTRRGKQKRVDYLLRLRRDLNLAVVEAKAAWKSALDGMQQARDYAQLLDLTFAYATNGKEIYEFDNSRGIERQIDRLPSPGELWDRHCKAHELNTPTEEALLEPLNLESAMLPRYYQLIAVNRAVEAIAKGDRRVLLTLATGTGKTMIAFQICWKLWSHRWNLQEAYRRPRILYLSDRTFLVDDPKDKDFAPFADARQRLEGEAVRGREVYFATYQAIAEDEGKVGLFRSFPSDFFDLVVVDECHRGSARGDSAWRRILNHFNGACHLGMTATPLRDETRDSYKYFGNPVFQYSLREGIEDGFLAPYRVHRVVTNVDATGWRPGIRQRDRHGAEIPDRLYGTPDFDRKLVLEDRTRAIARQITSHLKKTDRFAKTIVFCVDQEHASRMRQALQNENADLVKEHPDYVCRVTADEGELGRGYLSAFQDVDTLTPAIVTTSQLLTTGVDVPTCKNIVLARPVNSLVEFKQILGRGTRVRDDYGKLFFDLVDFTGSADVQFADPVFDGYPAFVEKVEIDESGETLAVEPLSDEGGSEPDGAGEGSGAVELGDLDDEGEPRKLYVDGVEVEVAVEVVREIGADGRPRIVKLTDYAGEQVRSLYTSAAALRSKWSDAGEREAVIDALVEHGIDFDVLTELSEVPGADPFDVLCHFAFDSPIRTRRERADRAREARKELFDRYEGEAREVLHELLEKYARYGLTQFKLPEVLQSPPISAHGNVAEIAEKFGGVNQLRTAVSDLEVSLYEDAA